MLICYFIVAQLPHEHNNIYVVFALNEFSCALFLGYYSPFCNNNLSTETENIP